MKVVIFLLLITDLLLGSVIDTKLYEGEEKETYYKEVQKQIETAQKNKQKSEQILHEEKLHLSRLRSTASQVIQIERLNIKPLLKKSVSLENYYNALGAVASLRVKQNQASQMLRSVNEKSMFSKKAIENILEDEKPKLLSYQLQYAYYKLQEKNIEEKLRLLKLHEEEISKILFSSISYLGCDSENIINENLKLNNNKIETYLSQKISVQIDIEKALIEDNTKIEKFQERMNSIETLYQKSLNKKVTLQIGKALCTLKKKKNKVFFKLVDEIEMDINSISKEELPLYIEEVKIIREISREVLGSTKLFFGATLYETNEILAQVKGYFISPLFVYNEQAISLLSIIKAIILIIIGLILGTLYKRWIASLSTKWPDMSQMSVRLASNIGYYLIVIISFMIAIGSLGIDMTSISLIAGALSIGIGFGLQTVVSNLIAGIILMFERTIRIGDTIELNDTLRGRVTDMRIRSTTIKTFDNIDIVIPNSSFIQNNVINWTLDDLTRRLHIPFSVAYGTDVDNVKNAILEELDNSDLKYIKKDYTKKPEVWMVSMNTSSVDFELLVWVVWDSRLRPNSLKSDFLILVYNTLNKHGIQIPFPQLDLHVKHMPK